MPREPRCGNNGATNGKSSVMRGADCDVGRVIEVGLVQKRLVQNRQWRRAASGREAIAAGRSRRAGGRRVVAEGSGGDSWGLVAEER